MSVKSANDRLNDFIDQNSGFYGKPTTDRYDFKDYVQDLCNRAHGIDEVVLKVFNQGVEVGTIKTTKEYFKDYSFHSYGMAAEELIINKIGQFMLEWDNYSLVKPKKWEDI